MSYHKFLENVTKCDLMSNGEKNSFINYKEKEEALSIRINAHKRFSSFSLEDWLDKNLPFKRGDIILDIGCGNGNFFPIYSKKLKNKGAIVGVDQSGDLLSGGMKCKCRIPVILLECDMNDKFPFIGNSFDYVISTFAIYYVLNVESIIKEVRRVLKPSGEVFLIGPTDSNAKELYEYNEKIFGFGRDEKVVKRTNRLEKEFYPAIKVAFGNVENYKIPSKLAFPSKAEFISYYMATLLYEESVKKIGFKPSEKKLFSVNTPSYEISKEMIVLRSKKND